MQWPMIHSLVRRGASQAVDLTDYISLREQPRIRAFDVRDVEGYE